MEIPREIVSRHIQYFFEKIVGFSEGSDNKYVALSGKENHYLAIVMDKIDRMTKSRGKLRLRTWSNCIFIFHQGELSPRNMYYEKISEFKREMPFLFVRSYVYFIFVDVSSQNQVSLLENKQSEIHTVDFKIWLFNSNYEIREATARSNLFDISLKSGENISDFMYLTNPESELERIQSANSDAVDCVRAFTNNLELLEQTSGMLNDIYKEIDTNPRARILIEGPARSGKTIIASSLLGKYKDAKFLLMNYYFYQAIVDGFHALSNWSREEIDQLVKNPELDFWIDIQGNVKRSIKSINRISRNLIYTIQEHYTPQKIAQLSNG